MTDAALQRARKWRLSAQAVLDERGLSLRDKYLLERVVNLAADVERLAGKKEQIDEECGTLNQVLGLREILVHALESNVAAAERERGGRAALVGRLGEALEECAAWLESRPGMTEGDAATSSRARHVLTLTPASAAHVRQLERVIKEVLKEHAAELTRGGDYQSAWSIVSELLRAALDAVAGG